MAQTKQQQIRAAERRLDTWVKGAEELPADSDARRALLALADSEMATLKALEIDGRKQRRKPQLPTPNS